MRGGKEQQAAMLLGVTADDLVPKEHPIRRIRSIVDAVLHAITMTSGDHCAASAVSNAGTRVRKSASDFRP